MEAQAQGVCLPRATPGAANKNSRGPFPQGV